MKFIPFALLLIATTAFAQTTRPDSTATAPSADQLLNQMMRPTQTEKDAPIAPQAAPVSTSARVPISLVNAGPIGILREGTDIVDRVGRIQKSTDGLSEDFIFESDGRALKDPPVGILPNLKLMQMETAVNTASHDLRFRVTGSVTEYRGRNYILLEKVVVVQDKDQEF